MTLLENLDGDFVDAQSGALDRFGAELSELLECLFRLTCNHLVLCSHSAMLHGSYNLEVALG